MGRRQHYKKRIIVCLFSTIRAGGFFVSKAWIQLAVGRKLLIPDRAKRNVLSCDSTHQHRVPLAFPLAHGQQIKRNGDRNISLLA
jgi:hypothetical protein